MCVSECLQFSRFKKSYTQINTPIKLSLQNALLHAPPKINGSNKQSFFKAYFQGASLLKSWQEMKASAQHFSNVASWFKRTVHVL